MWKVRRIAVAAVLTRCKLTTFCLSRCCRWWSEFQSNRFACSQLSCDGCGFTAHGRSRNQTKASRSGLFAADNLSGRMCVGLHWAHALCQSAEMVVRPFSVGRVHQLRTSEYDGSFWWCDAGQFTFEGMHFGRRWSLPNLGHTDRSVRICHGLSVSYVVRELISSFRLDF